MSQLNIPEYLHEEGYHNLQSVCQSFQLSILRRFIG